MARRRTLDRWLFTKLNQLPHPLYVDEQVSLLSDLGKGAGWVAGGVWLATRDGPRGRRAAVATVCSMLLGVVLAQEIKDRLPRKRPFARSTLTRRPLVRRLVTTVGKLPTDPSFPSGHTAGSFAAAGALAAFYPKDAPFLLLLASGVGASRVYLGHHFPSDVLVGAGLGAALGALGAKLAGPRPALGEATPAPAAP